MNGQRIVFHIDVNSAYLSWEAVYRLQHGALADLREIPSVVGGNEESRHGIVLAKSLPAKRFHIQTGETLYSARQKCPGLVVVPPHYWLYVECSNAMVQILREYSPEVQRFSVDECFLDYTKMDKHFGDPVKVANVIKNRIRDELGFTVNIGISVNKLLAKMAGELKKPDMVHTLYPDEIPEKMWPLPVKELIMVGRATAPKLHALGIHTIGDLAKCDVQLLESKLKSHGRLIWEFSNGIEGSSVRNDRPEMKGIGNSTTTPFDVTDEKTAFMFILSLTETVAMRLRDAGLCCSLVAVSIRNKDFISYARQRKIHYATDSTDEIYSIAKQLFREIWRDEPVRHLGVRVSALSLGKNSQLSFFTQKDPVKMKALDSAVDNIRLKHGSRAITRAAFAHSGISARSGGVGEEDYPIMSSIL
ncbi:DNA polymerase Y family protein [Candidatus Formimonas warabiya]|uniref:DNA polymerase Y family protein n=1 Tax=Formimonas warabiya TaxID=1761012 RepID=UPI0011D14C88|nr:DNA polymerase IV [Candidatus Formimonas warabiya]